MTDESEATADAGASRPQSPAAREDGWSVTAVDRSPARSAIPIVAVIGALVAGLVVGTVGTVIVYSVRRALRILSGVY